MCSPKKRANQGYLFTNYDDVTGGGVSCWCETIRYKMVNYCVCGGCTNLSKSGHWTFRFPSIKHPKFRAWVRFVKVKREDFNARSVTANSVICGAHFRDEDYNASDLMAHSMGFKSASYIKLKPSAVPSIHTVNPAQPSTSTSAKSAYFSLVFCSHFLGYNVHIGLFWRLNCCTLAPAFPPYYASL